MADQLPYSVDIDPASGTVTVTSYGAESQQYQASFVSSVPVPTLTAAAVSPTLAQEAAAVAQATNALALSKTAASKTVTKVATPKTH